MARDALYFLAPLVAAVAAALWVGWDVAAGVLLGLAAFVAFFFRDPRRDIPDDPHVIVSPADGRIVRIVRGEEVEVSIFLSLFDVHVNRAPIGGEVIRIQYRSGRFLAAFKPEASLENERNCLTVAGDGLTITFAQIAGVVARRIVCWKQVGDRVRKGERIGLIRFGSRVDLSLPADVDLKVKLGDRVRGGTSAIGIHRKA